MLETNLSEIGSYAIERRFISWWGKLVDGTGILHNILDGGEGSSGLKGKLNGMFGKTHTDVAREIMRQSMYRTKNHLRKWYNDGHVNKYTFECPDGFVIGRITPPTTKGRFWFNNGTIQISRKTKPDGDAWCSGMLPKKRKPPKEKRYEWLL